MEVKSDWTELIAQSTTYARCLFHAVPPRQFALAIGYSHKHNELLFLCFHAGGLTASEPLTPGSLNDDKKVIRLFLSLLTWDTRGYAGLPEWDNSQAMYISMNNDNQPMEMKVASILHDYSRIPGRSARVLLLKPQHIDSPPLEVRESALPQAFIQTAQRCRPTTEEEQEKAKMSHSGH